MTRRDEPFLFLVKGEPFVVVPYAVEHNDVVLFESRSPSAGFAFVATM